MLSVGLIDAAARSTLPPELAARRALLEAGGDEES
jgi:hypothetical protein